MGRLAVEYCIQKLRSGLPSYEAAFPLGGYPGFRNRLIKGNNPPATPENPFPDPCVPLIPFITFLRAGLKFSLERELVGSELLSKTL